MGLIYFRYWIPAALAAIGIAASVASSMGCDFMKVTMSLPGTVATEENPTIPMITKRYGLYGVHPSSSSSKYDESKCVSFSEADVSIDAPVRVGRLFAILGLVSALAGVLYLLAAPLPAGTAFYGLRFPAGRRRSRLWTWFAVLFTAWIVLLEGTTFVLYASDLCRRPGDDEDEDDAAGASTCGWSSGSTARATAVGLHVVAGIVMLVLGPPDTEQWTANGGETQTVTYRRQTQDDGTVVVVQTSVEKRQDARATAETYLKEEGKPI